MKPMPKAGVTCLVAAESNDTPRHDPCEWACTCPKLGNEPSCRREGGPCLRAVGDLLRRIGSHLPSGVHFEPVLKRMHRKTHERLLDSRRPRLEAAMGINSRQT